jgi:hypothetical protein
MRTYHERWRDVQGAEEVPLFGFPHGVGLEPVPVNVERMLSIFRQGVQALSEVWEGVLLPETRHEVMTLEGPTDGFHFPDPLWVRVIYDFALAYHRRVLPGDQLLRSLVPLYLGRTASFVLRTEDNGSGDVEAVVRGLADEFVRQKDSLRERWMAQEA